MNKKMYLRGLAGQIFYNSTEVLALALTYRPVPKAIEYVKNVRYGKEKNNYMFNFCLKDKKNDKKPLFIYIHGGGWISGLMTMRNPYICNWAKKGFFASSVNYSYAPQAVFPTQIKELFTALDYIIDRADEYNIDPMNTVIAGESAGGYFITYIANCLNNPQVLNKLGIEFRNIDKMKIKAVVSHCGCYDIKSMVSPDKKQSKFPDIKMMSATFMGMPVKKILEYADTEEGKLISPDFTDKFPPTYFTWCTNDYLRYEAFDLEEKFKKLGVTYRMFKGDGIIGNHAWTIVTMFKKARICLEDTFDFVLPYLPEYFSKSKESESKND
ncbi:MAG: alpha/beta hydrolase fold domain-containing protein [Clostridia bacterium]|nr:alpha/beta hydrolase fold domain-containing protein [Clostridia bacterium]